jgi:alkylhydroperoxidase/carboxymuconolactone decarboxylase family protein YurZ
MEPQAPHAYQEFTQRYPKIAQAWELLAVAGADGPLDPKSRRLLKLAIAIGAEREGAVRANVRKALALGIPPEEIHQVIALAAGTIGLPGTVAVFSWAKDMLPTGFEDQVGAGPQG